MAYDRVYIIYYEGQPFDRVQPKRYWYGRQPKRIYWKWGHAKAALTGILESLEWAEKYNKENAPKFDPSLFEIREFELVPVVKEGN